jgi:2-oxoglutarate dehydrogenase E2 component (dihydrolipoamide succinyltransferase)
MIEIILPAMGEGIIEAEITRWLVQEGMQVEADQPLVEVATDKVDSEIPSPGSGIIHKILLNEGDTAKVGQVMALISESGTSEAETVPGGEALEAESPAAEDESPAAAQAGQSEAQADQSKAETGQSEAQAGQSEAQAGQSEAEAGPGEAAVGKSAPATEALEKDNDWESYGRVAFLSPVVRKIAVENGLAPDEILRIDGSGLRGRITKADILNYLLERPEDAQQDHSPARSAGLSTGKATNLSPAKAAGLSSGNESEDMQEKLLSREQIYGSGPSTVEEMDRLRRLIADHMVYSKRVAPHVSSFVECDVTEMIHWRERAKEDFRKKYGQKLTVTTLILDAVIRSLKEHPGINVSVDGYKIIRKQGIHLGMATALPDGNLIVPVIHDADKLNLQGLAAKVNDLAERARNNSLQPGEIQGGTFTVTNIGQFGNIGGTPIIHQPQVAILAVGAIVKKPAVVETPQGDNIGIRHILMLTLAYDHRVVDGALGGTFLKSIGDHLENFDPERTI